MVKGKSCKGFNFFDAKDRSVMAAIHDPVFDIKGVKRSNLIKAIPGLTPSQASYFLKRLRHHKLIKKEHRSHSYTLTYEGRRALTAFRHVEHLSILPLLSA
jgi:RIO-like serine/threonine protein kinase